MKYTVYINHAREQGIPLTLTHVTIYLRNFAAPRIEKHFYDTLEIIELDPQEVYQKSTEWLDSRQHAPA